MPGERDALRVEARAAGDVDVHDRQRNRDPEAALEDHVEQAVPEVIVVGAIAGEALALEEQPVEGPEARMQWRGTERLECVGSALTKLFQQRKRQRGIEIGYRAWR